MKVHTIFTGLIAVLSAMALIGVGPSAREARAEESTYPDLVPLPDGWQPEGIVVGKGDSIYSGSRANGGIYVADLRTGEGSILVEPHEGREAVGLSFDERSGYIFAAGGGGGNAYVYDSGSGELVGEYELPICEEGTFVNDVVVTREAAFLTDSQCPLIYRIPLGPGGSLPDQEDVEVIPLGGDYSHQEGFNANGIDAMPNGSTLVIVQSNSGLLYKVDPSSGEATIIDLGGELVTNGDGILLDGKKLFVVRNRDGVVTAVDLSPDLLSGTITDEITSDAFRIPTTIAKHGKQFYVVNARFGVENPTAASYEIVRVP